MNSFYEQPRSAPVPTSADKVVAVPVVPEVSIIFQNNTEETSAVDSMYLSYGAWKARNQSETGASTVQDLLNLSECTQAKNLKDYVRPRDTRRQVRFESPVLQQQQQYFPSNGNVFSTNTVSVPLSKPGISSPLQNNNTVDSANTSLPVKSNIFTKPFEQIYMANIPNRHLDLSIIDHPKVVPVYKENLENINPNVNLRSNTPASKPCSTEKPVREAKNYLGYSANVTDVIRKGMNEKSKDNSQEYPKILDTSVSSRNVPSEDCSLPKQGVNTNELLEKSHVIDLYNYKCGTLGNASVACTYRQALDNTFANNYETVRSQPDSTKSNIFLTNSSKSRHSQNCDNSFRKCNYRKLLKGNLKCNTAIQTEIPTNSCKSVDANADDPTVKDLLKIIQQQNDQLLILQKQVAALLSSQEGPKQIEAAPCSNQNFFGDDYRTSTQFETQGLMCNPMQKNLSKKGPLRQFSLDVMTSFEVSIRRQQNHNRACKEATNHQPKICEITESDSSSLDQIRDSGAVKKTAADACSRTAANDTLKNTEVSLTLNEPVQVQEMSPSPDNTIQIDMKDYSSDSDDENSTGAGWTFYNNVMGQVNHILKKSGMQPGYSPSLEKQEVPDSPASQDLMKKVKQATIKHLKSIGVHIPAADDSNDSIEAQSMNRAGYKQNEVSFAVKQLLMKYLPDEQLAKVAYRQADHVQHPERVGRIKRRPEFSFATVQYMQKYNLLTDIPNTLKFAQPQVSPAIQQEEDFERILDVTAIRQQPKLL